ncbi:unnamed protein product [Lymnaea stagnalis]|uniref:Uncharacterized protein n=1 Tax=Lymnaea stagnalis TaxID=6523 RepID=A0AAV2I0H2_LYMST
MARLELLLTVLAVCILYPAAGKDDFLEDVVLEAMTLTLFPGYLKTEEEFNAIREQNRKLMSQRERASCDKHKSVVNHACCQSEDSVYSPSELLDANNQMRKLVHFHARRQYFPTETCVQVSNCQACGCAMVNQTFSALVENPNFPHSSPFRVQLWLVSAPTFCRCFNNRHGGQTPSQGDIYGMDEDDDNGKGENDYGKGENDYGKGENDYGKGENDYGKGENDYGKGENDYGKGENDYGKGENDYGKGENDDAVKGNVFENDEL